MVRAGLVRQLGTGLWTWLPAGWRVHENVAQIVREELDAIGAPGDADAGDQPGRDLAAQRPLRDRRAVQAPGPPRRRARAGDDARGGRDDARRAGRALVPRPAVQPLPLPGQGPRRAAPARRRPPHARVHHEGRLHLRPRPRGPRRALRALPRGLRPDLRPGRARVVPRRVRRRDDGRRRRPRVHGAVARRARTTSRSRPATPPTSRSRAPTRKPVELPDGLPEPAARRDARA